MEDGTVEHNFETDPPKDHFCQDWFDLVEQFQRKSLNVFKMAAVTKNRNFFNCPLLL
jgi:hypothetical protein